MQSRDALRELLKEDNRHIQSSNTDKSKGQTSSRRRAPPSSTGAPPSHGVAANKSQLKGNVYLPLIERPAVRGGGGPFLTRLFEHCENRVFRSQAIASADPSVNLSNLSLQSPRDGGQACTTSPGAATPSAPPSSVAADTITASGAPTTSRMSEPPSGRGPHSAHEPLSLAVSIPRTPGSDGNAGQAAQQAAQQQQQDEQLSYARRCQADTEVLLASCPATLRHVNQVFMKQAQAFECADRLNSTLPLLPEPTTIVSALAHAPRPCLLEYQQQAQAMPAATRQGQLVGAAGLAGDGPVGGRGTAQPRHPGGQQHVAQDAPAPLDALPGLFVPAGAAGPPPGMHHPSTFATLEERRQQERLQSSNREALRDLKERYLALLAETRQRPRPEAPAAAATEQQQQLQRHGDGDASAAAAAPETGSAAGEAPAREAPRHQEAVVAFCIERRNERLGTYYRSFAAASYSAVWAAHLSTHPSELHWYEVIRVGRPCHLYFDLEYPARLNPGTNGPALVDTLLGLVATALQRNFGLALDPGSVYELDSTTADKFSRHLIVRVAGHAFYDNAAAGQFVAAVLAAAGDRLSVVAAAADGSPAGRASFVDAAVYSRNRHLRMAYSSKGGKAAVLRPTGRYATAPGPACPTPARVFQDTLVCRVDPGAKLLLMRSPCAATARREVLQGEVGGPGASGGGGGGERSVTWKHDGRGAADTHRTQALKALAEQAVGFIESAATRRGGQQARARTVAFCGFDGLVAYSMIGPGSHFCENIGRAHSSNHVYFVANFERGVFAQKCHDPSCAGYRSAWMPLPEDLCMPRATA